MPLPWLRIIDAIIGVTTLVRSRTPRAHSDGPEQLVAGSRTLGRLEMRVAGIIVAALKEAFDRDSRRLGLEREQMEAERQRAERALRLELLRQAGDREIGRLRFVAGIAVASWLGSTLFFSARLIGGSLGARAALGAAWASLVAALASAFVAQSRIANALGRIADAANVRPDELSAGISGAIAPWLIVFGLALIAIAVLVV